MILRSLSATLNLAPDSKKAVIILGPRQAGKTTLVKSIAEAASIV